MRSLEKRTKQLFLRNAFYGPGKYGMPIISRDNIDLENFEVIGFHNTKTADIKNRGKTVYFFMDDDKFNCVWNKPENYIEKLRQYKQVFSPDFSLYTDMPRAMQIYNTFRRRWCGAFWQSKGIKVIPAVTWSDKQSYEFSFEGILNGSITAVSTLGTKRAKNEFLAGFEEMCGFIKPAKIICFCTPYKEMYNAGIEIIHCEPDGRTRQKRKEPQKSKNARFLF